MLTARETIACTYVMAVLVSRASAIAIALNQIPPLLAFVPPPTKEQIVLDFADRQELGAGGAQVPQSFLVTERGDFCAVGGHSSRQVP